MILEIVQLLVDLALVVGLLHLWRQVRRLEKKPSRPIPAAKGSSVPVDVVTVLLALLACGGAFAQPPVEPADVAPGGSDRQVQFNDAGSFGASSGLTYDSSSVFTLTYPGAGWPFGRAMRITNTGQTFDIFNSGPGGQSSLIASNIFAVSAQGGAQAFSVRSWGFTFDLKRADGVQSVTCADSGDANPGAVTITPTTSFSQLTNSDANGCVVTLSESGAVSGQSVEIIVVSSAGGTVDFADTAGVTELAGAYSAGAWDALTLRYAVDRWVETARSNN